MGYFSTLTVAPVQVAAASEASLGGVSFSASEYPTHVQLGISLVLLLQELS